MAEIEWRDIKEWFVEIGHLLENIDTSIGSVDSSLTNVAQKLDKILQALQRIEAKTR